MPFGKPKKKKEKPKSGLILVKDGVQREVSFEENLRKACAGRLRLAQVPLPPGGIPIESPQNRLSRVRDEKSDYFNGVNNVNIQEEMTDLQQKVRAVLDFITREVKSLDEVSSMDCTANNGSITFKLQKLTQRIKYYSVIVNY